LNLIKKALVAGSPFLETDMGGGRIKDGPTECDEHAVRLKPKVAVKSGKQKHVGDRTENPLPEQDRSQKPSD
jgi:hypothetical protein